MQQNTVIQLDRISKDDKFSPDTLNHNAAQVEAALNTMSTMMAAGDAALRTELERVDERVALLEAKKIVAGLYTGDGASARIIDLGFTPIALFIQYRGSGFVAFAVPGGGNGVSIVENGFQVVNNGSDEKNYKGFLYQFMAFG